VKVRLVQDHDALPQPWYRLEKHLPNIDRWYMIASGQNLERLRERMARVIEVQTAEHQITVIEEKET
jgi:hypothetical protein